MAGKEPDTGRLAEGEGIEPLASSATLVFKTSCRPFSGALHWRKGRELNPREDWPRLLVSNQTHYRSATLPEIRRWIDSIDIAERRSWSSLERNFSR